MVSSTQSRFEQRMTKTPKIKQQLQPQLEELNLKGNEENAQLAIEKMHIK